ncbi:MAG: hypothetical protein JSV86_00220 [Gemmatimonadota bacterium]|nr:MAG: hypothetical protein JSV86_00220 [Gemmatimonadota bacterium]
MSKQQKSYAQELRDSGAESSSRNGQAPFIRWPEKGDDREAYVEGTVMEVWKGDFGEVARVLVDKAAPGMVAVTGKDKDLKEYPVEVGMIVNVGLSCANLKNTISPDRRGEVVCVCHEGWGTTKRTKQDFRKFDVLWPKGLNPEDLEAEQDDLPFEN